MQNTWEEQFRRIKRNYDSGQKGLEDRKRLVGEFIEIIAILLQENIENIDVYYHTLSDWFSAPQNKELLDFFNIEIKRFDENSDCHHLLNRTNIMVRDPGNIPTVAIAANEQDTLDQWILELTKRKNEVNNLDEKLLFDRLIVAFTTIQSYLQHTEEIKDRKTQIFAQVAPVLTSASCLLFFPGEIALLLILLCGFSMEPNKLIAGAMPRRWKQYVKPFLNTFQKMNMFCLRMALAGGIEFVKFNYTASNGVLTLLNQVNDYFLSWMQMAPSLSPSHHNTFFHNNVALEEKYKDIVCPLLAYRSNQRKQVAAKYRQGKIKSELIDKTLSSIYFLIDRQTDDFVIVRQIEASLTSLLQNPLITGSGEKAVASINKALNNCQIMKNTLASKERESYNRQP